MVNSTPNPIKNYYIAYFDILGYKDFFSTNPEKAPEFLNVIHNAIHHAADIFSSINQSPLASAYGKIDIKVKIFSDNFLLCLEETDDVIESVRIITLLKCVADIQRTFVTEYGLFVRGGITKGLLSFHDDYVFGDGLIKVVLMENNAKYPRIVVDPQIGESLLINRLFSDEDTARALEIERRVLNQENPTNEELFFYQSTFNKGRMQIIILKFAQALIFQWADQAVVLNYLYQVQDYPPIPTEELKQFAELMKQISPYDYEKILQAIGDIEKNANNQGADYFDKILITHKEAVEKQLKKFGNNRDLPVENIREAELRESILRKYVWVMAYHNLVCVAYQRPQHKILTSCNCDTRFLKMTIEVLEDETGI